MIHTSRKAMVPMSIRLRTLLIVVASTLLFLGGMSALSGMLVLDSYRDLESQSLFENSARAENILARETEALLRVNRDWAFWDDTYAYMDNMSGMYEAVNLQEETLETLHLAAMVFLSPDGTVVSSGPVLTDGAAAFMDRIRHQGTSLAGKAGGDGFSGFFLNQDRLFMVSGAPILRSDGSGPPKGVLLFVREIGEQEAASLTESLLLPLKIHPAGDSLPENLREMLDSVTSAEKGFLSRPVSPEVITGFSVLRDIDGLPAALLEISSLRSIFLQGKRTVLQFFLWLALFGGFQTAVILLLLKWTVTGRLESARRLLEKIAFSGRVGERMPLSGSDEITSLSGSINSMLASLERLVENIPDPLFLSDGGRIVHANREACSLLGTCKSALIGEYVSSFLMEEDPLSQPQEDSSPVYEGKLLPPGRSGVPVEIHRQSFLLGERKLTLAVARDITRRRTLEDSLRRMAYFDDKTGLPNRTRFLMLADEAVRSRESFTVALLDMDRFRLINDMIGPAKGDDLLREFSHRIQGVLSPGDVVARVGGDAFGIILRKRETWEEASPVLIQVKKEVMTPLFVDGQTVFPSVSMGVLPDAGRCGSASSALAKAETALLRAKGRGLGQTALFREDEAGIPDILTAEGQLRKALEQGELTLHYQPIVRLKGKGVEGFEALVRWRHPDRGIIPPGEFIPLAEETGLITEIDRWAAGQVCRDINRFREMSGKGMKVSVNASARSILEEDYCARLAAETKGAGISPRLLTVEITEGVLISNPSAASASLAALRREGISVALDDFGTGYSSLQYLSSLPIDRLKIDGSFIRRLFTGDGDRRLVKGILALASDLGMETVTECIEREDEFLWTLEHGATHGQGYFFGYPRPFEETAEMLQKTPPVI